MHRLRGVTAPEMFTGPLTNRPDDGVVGAVLISREILDALAAQWKISATGKRTHKIDALRVYAESVAAFPFPKLLKVKPVEIRH